MIRRTAAAVFILFVALTAAAWAKTAFPKFTNYVVDSANVVPDDVEQRVDADLESYQDRSTNQIAVAVVNTTGSQAIEDYSIDLARAWGVGQKGKDNGVLILIAFKDRKLRIEVGRGLEGDLTDLQSGRIIRDQMVPHLQAGDVGGAVVAGEEAVRADLGDKNVTAPAPVEPDVPPSGTPTDNFGWVFALIPIVLIFLAFSSRRRGLGWLIPLFWGFGGGGGYGGGGFGGGGFGGGGGGFGGGGGGGFGGGGASGGW